MVLGKKEKNKKMRQEGGGYISWQDGCGQPRHGKIEAAQASSEKGEAERKREGDRGVDEKRGSGRRRRRLSETARRYLD
jgi:hypothetical protein